MNQQSTNEDGATLAEREKIKAVVLSLEQCRLCKKITECNEHPSREDETIIVYLCKGEPQDSYEGEAQSFCEHAARRVMLI